MNSDGFFDIERLPKKVAIVGAGYIAVEFAGIFNALGAETHLFIRHDTFLRDFDPMIQESVTKEYERLGVHLHRRTNLQQVEKSLNGKLSLTYKDDAGCENVVGDVDHLIWAIGRAPVTAGIGLEKAGVEVDKNGYIPVDMYQNTNISGIYALGDVTGQAELTPVAIAAGRRLSQRLFGGPTFSSQSSATTTSHPSCFPIQRLAVSA